MDKFHNKYRIDSTRLKNWNYAWPGSYFVTIITFDRENFFGNVVDGRMIHNDIGIIAVEEWIKSPQLRPDMNLTLGEFVVMPNHLHGIITIGKNEYNRDYQTEKAVLQTKVLSPQCKNLSSIIRGYKSSVTKLSHLTYPQFKWQERFHDRIIKSEEEYKIIEIYIRNNPLNWINENNSI